MIKIFDTLQQYNNYTADGLKSGITYYVKEDGSIHFYTNNIDGTLKVYDGIGEVPNYLYGAAIYVKYNKTKDYGYNPYICAGLNSVTNTIDYAMVDGNYISGADLKSKYGQYPLENGEHQVIFVLNTKEIPDDFFNINTCGDMMKEVVVSDYYTSIGKQFISYDAPNLKSIHIGDNITSIGEDFLGLHNESIQKIHIPKNIETIGRSCFRNTSIKQLIFPNTITSIGSTSFSDSTSLEEVVIPDSENTINIEGSAFAKCPKLKKVYLGKGATLLVSSVFDYCHIEELYLNTSTTPSYNYTGDKQNSLKKLTIGSNVTAIQGSEFSHCNALSEIIFEEGCTTLNDYCLNGNQCVVINLPSTITQIGDGVFNDCTELTELNIQEGCTKLGQYCFENNPKLKHLVLPSTISNIGKWCFSRENSWSKSYLETLTVKATTPPSTGGVLGLADDCIIYVPADSVDAYKAATNWSKYASRIQAIPTE